MKTINNVNELLNFYKVMKKAGKKSYNVAFIKLCIDLCNFEFGKTKYVKDILKKCKNVSHAKHLLCKLTLKYYSYETTLHKALVKSFINSYLVKLDYDRLAKIEYEIFEDEKLKVDNYQYNKIKKYL